MGFRSATVLLFLVQIAKQLYGGINPLDKVLKEFIAKII